MMRPRRLPVNLGGGGDIDTICAIVGGVAGVGSGRESIPAEWLASREGLTI